MFHSTFNGHLVQLERHLKFLCGTLIVYKKTSHDMIFLPTKIILELANGYKNLKKFRNRVLLYLINFEKPLENQ